MSMFTDAEWAATQQAVTEPFAAPGPAAFSAQNNGGEKLNTDAENTRPFEPDRNEQPASAYNETLVVEMIAWGALALAAAAFALALYVYLGKAAK
jgi:hypothetical protein